MWIVQIKVKTVEGNAAGGRAAGGCPLLSGGRWSGCCLPKILGSRSGNMCRFGN